MLRQVFKRHLSHDSVKCFASGKVMTSFTRSQTMFDEGQKLKHMHMSL
jgi:hypothetical protein